MKDKTVTKINRINEKFYQKTAGSFDQSRQYPWAGWEKINQIIKSHFKNQTEIKVLDLACGNGRLGAYLAKQLDQKINYHGWDNNPALLKQAQKQLTKTKFSFQFKKIDIINNLMENKKIIKTKFDVIFCFGFWHHIPGQTTRQKLLEEIKQNLTEEGLAVITFWQFADQARFQEKLIKPEKLGLAGQLEEGDYFLDWQGKNTARFAHYTPPQQAKEICQKAGFKIIEDFLSDGKNNQLNYYLILSG